MNKLLLLLVFASSMAHGQYEGAEDICRIDDVETYSQCTHLLRVEEGLYTLSQFPYLMNWLDSKVLLEEWKEAQDLALRSNWLLGRNDPDLRLYRQLQSHLIFTPETDCFERDESDNYTRHTEACRELRYYLADSLILALEIQQKIYAISDRTADLEAIIGLAEGIASMVYGIDGNEFVFDGVSGMVRNNLIRERYQFRIYQSIARRARDGLSR